MDVEQRAKKDEMGVTTPPIGYHLKEIPKGILGEPSKIREELEELEDAIAQGVKLMVLMELSDLYGALKAVADVQGVTMEDLRAMHEVTERAFKNGRRS